MEGEVGALSKLVPRFSHPAQGGGSDLCAIVAFRLLFGVSRVGGNLWVLFSGTFFIFVFVFVCVRNRSCHKFRAEACSRSTTTEPISGAGPSAPARGSQTASSELQSQTRYRLKICSKLKGLTLASRVLDVRAPALIVRGP